MALMFVGIARFTDEESANVATTHRAALGNAIGKLVAPLEPG